VAVEKLTVSVAEAVEATGLSRTTLNRLLAKGELPSALVGGRRLIRVSDLEAFIDSRMVA
jgi:excisionase family DNA binding protein